MNTTDNTMQFISTDSYVDTIHKLYIEIHQNTNLIWIQKQTKYKNNKI